MRFYYAGLILLLAAFCRASVSRSEETTTAAPADEDFEAVDSMISEILGTRPVQVLSEAPATTTLRTDLAPGMRIKSERLSSLQQDLVDPAKSTPRASLEVGHDDALRSQMAIQQELSAARAKLNELDGVIQSGGSAIKSRLESIRRKVLMLTSAL